jgi:hypothetical protein
VDNPHHKYEDASNTWSEIEWTTTPKGVSFSNIIRLPEEKMRALSRTSRHYDLAMSSIGRCKRLSFASRCECENECMLVNMHLKWKDKT